jgi:hypothetical protein
MLGTLAGSCGQSKCYDRVAFWQFALPWHGQRPDLAAIVRCQADARQDTLPAGP